VSEDGKTIAGTCTLGKEQGECVLKQIEEEK